MIKPKLALAMLVALALVAYTPVLSSAQSSQSTQLPAPQSYATGQSPPSTQPPPLDPSQSGQPDRQGPLPKGGVATVIGVDQPENCLRIRSGPGNEYEVIGCAELGQQVDITGVWTSNNWAQLVDNGWVYGSQIQTDLRPPATAYEPKTYVEEEYPVVYGGYTDTVLPAYGYQTYWNGGLPLYVYDVNVWRSYYPWWWWRYSWWWKKGWWPYAKGWWPYGKGWWPYAKWGPYGKGWGPYAKWGPYGKGWGKQYGAWNQNFRNWRGVPPRNLANLAGVNRGNLPRTNIGALNRANLPRTNIGALNRANLPRTNIAALNRANLPRTNIGAFNPNQFRARSSNIIGSTRTFANPNVIRSPRSFSSPNIVRSSRSFSPGSFRMGSSGGRSFSTARVGGFSGVRMGGGGGRAFIGGGGRAFAGGGRSFGGGGRRR